MNAAARQKQEVWSHHSYFEWYAASFMQVSIQNSILLVFQRIHNFAPTDLYKRLTLKPKRGLRFDNKLALHLPLTKLKLKAYGDHSISMGLLPDA